MSTVSVASVTALVATASLLFMGCATQVAADHGPVGEESACARVLRAEKGCAAEPVECQHKCSCNDYDACSMLGHLYEDGAVRADGSSFPANPIRAFELYLLACDGRSNLGCSNLGNAYERGVIVAPSSERARHAFTKVCENGDGWGCMRLGTLVLSSDRPAGLAALRRSCQLANVEGCWVFANTMLDGASLLEREEALAALGTACKTDTSSVANDYVRARAQGFVAKACAKLSELTAPFVETAPRS